MKLSFENIPLLLCAQSSFNSFNILFQFMIDSQDDQLELIGSSVGVLKNVSHQIGQEMDEQAV